MKNVYSVCQVNSYIKNMFAQDYMLGLVYVRGELSNVKYHTSGHIYFTLKDEKAAINCVMFASARSGLTFRLQEGQQVIACGSVEVYERDGKYQLYAKQIKQDGQGNLQERFEALKQKLEEMGMFAKEYKQALPEYIQTLGVVTAPTGAAVQDIISVSKRRNPYIRIVLYPAIVQGEQAPDSIVEGIQLLEKYGVDTIIVGRGGGSAEDLFAFNEERVAQAIFDCMTPIISAVGHETDFTIADFVADLRAPTPSAAAELAVFDYTEFQEKIQQRKKRLQQLMLMHLQSKKAELEPRKLRLQHLSPVAVLNEKRTRLLASESQLQALMEEKLANRRHEMEIYIERLKGLSPLDKLNQGYSYVSVKGGKTLTDIKQVKKGDILSIYVQNGMIDAEVLEWEEQKRK